MQKEMEVLTSNIEHESKALLRIIPESFDRDIENILKKIYDYGLNHTELGKEIDTFFITVIFPMKKNLSNQLKILYGTIREATQTTPTDDKQYKKILEILKALKDRIEDLENKIEDAT